MLFERATVYGILALAYMAKQETDAPQRVDIIAREADLPRVYLRKLMDQLTDARLLTRGHAGRLKLARLPRQITLLQIVEAIEGPVDPVWVLIDDLVSGHGAAARGLDRWRQRTAKQMRTMLEETTLGDFSA